MKLNSLVFANKAHDAALDCDVFDEDWGHGGVGRFKADTSCFFEKPFEGGGAVV